MKHAYLVLFLMFFACNNKQKNNDPENFKSKETNKGVISQINDSLLVSVNKSRTSPKSKKEKELDYIERRNSALEYFERKEINEKVYSQMNDSLLVLEKLLRDILTNSKLKNINKTGKIALETFFNEIGFGMLDGLLLHEQTHRVFCTSEFIFFDFYKNKKMNQFDKLTPSNLETIFNNAFYTDAKMTNLSSNKITITDKVKAYGMMGVVGQDIGPGPPQFLYVLVSTDNNIYLIEKTIKQELSELEICRNIWDSIYNKSLEKLKVYRGSKLKDTTLVNEAHAYENKAWENYCDCYQKNFKDDKQFVFLKKELDNMLNLIID